MQHSHPFDLNKNASYIWIISALKYSNLQSQWLKNLDFSYSIINFAGKCALSYVKLLYFANLLCNRIVCYLLIKVFQYGCSVPSGKRTLKLANQTFSWIIFKILCFWNIIFPLHFFCPFQNSQFIKKSLYLDSLPNCSKIFKLGEATERWFKTISNLSFTSSSSNSLISDSSSLLRS
jgi:hypothetical protein